MKSALLFAILSLLAAPAFAQDEIPADRYQGIGFEILDADERQTFVDLASGELCPCPGAPISLAECLAEAEVCSLAREVAWLMFRHIKEDMTAAEVRERLTRFITQATTPRDFELEGAPVRGSTDADVQIVVFSDFECPHCRRFVTTGEQLCEEFGDQIALYFKHFPIPSHANAMHAARAASAAGRQDRFWEMHDTLFENQSRLQTARDIDAVILELAQEVGLDVDQFRTDYADPALQTAAEHDRDEGRAAGVNSTPTCFINGLMYNDSESFEAIQAHVQSLLDAASPN